MKIYVEHKVTTLEELNALALKDGTSEQNDSYVIGPDGYDCTFSTHGCPREEGNWWWDDSLGGDCIQFPLRDGEAITVLVAQEAQEETRAVCEEGLDGAGAHVGVVREVETRLVTAWESTEEGA